ncbi:hypothetical protein HPB50_023523 [Hyalomma asiaticum]|uniref:Uncharacterized protein n=1 Tax=Hyalomma asiaticum TaxID=266040 RepID=A0ACB7SHC6_HYAAI|nr:hypothetical protein HPB50_023523 [Hyalomma asiaticum]
MELVTLRRHRIRQLLLTVGVTTVLIILWASVRDLRNVIGGGTLSDFVHQNTVRMHQNDSNGSRHDNDVIAWKLPVRVLGRFRHESVSTVGLDYNDGAVHVLLIFTEAREAIHMHKKLSTCLGSLIALSSVPLRIYIVTDGPSADVAREVLANASTKASSDVLAELLHADDVLAAVQDLVSFMRPHFSDSGYFSKTLFYLTTGVHRLFPAEVRRLIVLDIDIQLRSDIALLHRHFALFPPGAIMGMSHELQPGYRHLLRKYRQEHPGTLCGEPSSRGNPGFNAGVALVDLEARRWKAGTPPYAEPAPTWSCQCSCTARAPGTTERNRELSRLPDAEVVRFVRVVHGSARKAGRVLLRRDTSTRSSSISLQPDPSSSSSSPPTAMSTPPHLRHVSFSAAGQVASSPMIHVTPRANLPLRFLF